MPEQNAARRCPNCGALASADAEWCGQCFASLAAVREAPAREAHAASSPAPQPSAPDEPAAPAGETASRALWPCPACGHQNALELSACEVCGTSFGDLLRRGEPRPKVDPREAVRRSLLFPGLGHALLGMGTEGFARGTLFVVVFGMTVLLLASGANTGLAAVLLSLYGLITVGVYLGAAFEASRIAKGGAPFVSGRLLLWAIGGLIIVTTVVFAFGVTTAARS